MSFEFHLRWFCWALTKSLDTFESFLLFLKVLLHMVSCDWPVRNTWCYWPEFLRCCTMHDNWKCDFSFKITKKRCLLLSYIYIYSVSQKKIPPGGSWHFSFFFTNGWEFLIDFLHTYYTFLSTLDKKQIFIQLSPILTKLCHIKRDYRVHIICSKCPQSAETHALTRLRKSLIALLIVVCGK